MLHAAVAPSLPASAVTHAVHGRFSDAALLPREVAGEVVVVRYNRLCLYHTYASVPRAAKDDNDDDDNEDDEEEDRHATTAPPSHTASVMRCVAEVTLHAPVVDVAACRPARRSRSSSSSSGGDEDTDVDVLICLFDDTHVSLLQYNALLQRFDTVALVQLDERCCTAATAADAALPPLLRVDRDSSTVAVLARRTTLFTFTVLQRVHKDDADVAHDDNTTAAVAAVDDDVAERGASDSVPPPPQQQQARVALSAWGDDDDDDDDEQQPQQRQQHKDNVQAHVKADDNDDDNARDTRQQQPHQPPSPPQPHALAHDRVCDLLTGDVVVRVSAVSCIALSRVKETLRNVRDVCFVATATSEPLLALLYEPHSTWAGRVRLIDWRSKTVQSHMLSCAVAWAKLTRTAAAATTTTTTKTARSDANDDNNDNDEDDDNDKVAAAERVRLVLLSEVEHVPYTATHLTPLPPFRGVPSAVLCVARNALLHVSTRSGCAAYVNRSGRDEAQSTRTPAIRYTALQWSDARQAASRALVKTNINLANATVIPLTQHARSSNNNNNNDSNDDDKGSVSARHDGDLRLLLVTEDEGTMLEVRVRSDGGGVVTGFVGRIVSTNCYCSCYAPLCTTRTTTAAAALQLLRDGYFLGSSRGDSRVIARVTRTTTTRAAGGAAAAHAHSDDEDDDDNNKGNDNNKARATVTSWTVLQTFVSFAPVQHATLIDDRHAVSVHDNSNNSNNNNTSLALSFAASPYAKLLREGLLDGLPLRHTQHNAAANTASPSLTSDAAAAATMATCRDDGDDDAHDLLLCSGYGASGALSLLRRAVRTRVLRREAVHAVSAFFLDDSDSDDSSGSVVSTQQQQLQQQQQQQQQQPYAAEDVTATPAAPLLLLSGTDFTMLFAVRSDAVEQVVSTMLHAHARTVLATYVTLQRERALLQVTPHELRVTTANGRRLLLRQSLQQQQQQQQQQEEGDKEDADDTTATTAATCSVRAAWLLSRPRSVLLLLYTSGELCACALHEVTAEASTPPLRLLLTRVRSCTYWRERGLLCVVHDDDLLLLDAQTWLQHANNDSSNSSAHDGDNVATSPAVRFVFRSFALLPMVAVAGDEALTHAATTTTSTTTATAQTRLLERLRHATPPHITHMHVLDHDDCRDAGHGGEEDKGADKEATLSTLMTTMTTPLTATLLLIVATGELVTYTMLLPSTPLRQPQKATLSSSPSSPPPHAPARLLKQLHHLLDVQPERDVAESLEAKKQRLRDERAQRARDTLQARDGSERIVPVNDVYGHRGVYVCGQHPVFVLLLPRDTTTDNNNNNSSSSTATATLAATANKRHAPRDNNGSSSSAATATTAPRAMVAVLCRHDVRGPVHGFARFCSQHVRSAMVYCAEGAVCFATCAPHSEARHASSSSLSSPPVLLESGWWLQRRVALAATPHYAVYNAATHCCFVVTSSPEPFAPRKAPFDVQLRVQYDDETGAATTSVEPPVVLPPLLPTSADAAPTPMTTRYAVRCVDCDDWQLPALPAATDDNNNNNDDDEDAAHTATLMLEPNEVVLGAACVYIARDTALDVTPRAAVAPVCALATAFPLGEDVTTRGRVVLLSAYRTITATTETSVADGGSNEAAAAVVRAKGGVDIDDNDDDAAAAAAGGSGATTQTRHSSPPTRSLRLRVLHSQPMQGPVTAIACMQPPSSALQPLQQQQHSMQRGRSSTYNNSSNNSSNHVVFVAAVGGTVRVLRYDSQSRQLETMAMLYAGIYVTSLSTMREYVVYGDLQQSAAMARYSAANRTLTLLGSDVNGVPVVTCDVLHHDRAFAVVVADEHRQLALLGYTPRVRSTGSGGGDGGGGSSAAARVVPSLLTVDGEYRMAGGVVATTLRVRSRRVPASVLVYATHAGEVGFVVALGEQTDRTGQWVSRRLQGDVAHAAGLPPRLFLGFRGDDARRAMCGKQRLLHAPLLRAYYTLDAHTRNAIAVAALTQLERVLNVGATIDAETCVL